MIYSKKEMAFLETEQLYFKNEMLWCARAFDYVIQKGFSKCKGFQKLCLDGKNPAPKRLLILHFFGGVYVCIGY